MGYYTTVEVNVYGNETLNAGEIILLIENTNRILLSEIIFMEKSSFYRSTRCEISMNN